MAKPNYKFKKRQKELAKKEKKELKKQRKLDQKSDISESHDEGATTETTDNPDNQKTE